MKEKYDRFYFYSITTPPSIYKKDWNLIIDIDFATMAM